MTKYQNNTVWPYCEILIRSRELVDGAAKALGLQHLGGGLVVNTWSWGDPEWSVQIPVHCQHHCGISNAGRCSSICSHHQDLKVKAESLQLPLPYIHCMYLKFINAVSLSNLTCVKSWYIHKSFFINFYLLNQYTFKLYPSNNFKFKF